MTCEASAGWEPPGYCCAPGARAAAGDAGAALRALARGGRDAVGLRLRGRRVLLVLDPDLAGELLSGHAASTAKGPACSGPGPCWATGC